jgi:transposase
MDQWQIGGKMISVIAAYSTQGFLCWRVHYGTPINHRSVVEFLNQDLKPFLDLWPKMLVLSDNASIHHEYDAVDVLSNVTGGRYKFLSTYSPDFDPIEKGFSNVWNRVQAKPYDEVLKHPIAAINEAFENYSFRGEGGPRARKHFNLYKRNHKVYLAQYSHLR